MKKAHTFFLLLTSIITASVCAGAFLFLLHVIEHKNEHTLSVRSSLENKELEKNTPDQFKQEVATLEKARSDIRPHMVDIQNLDIFTDHLKELGHQAGATAVISSVTVSPYDNTVTTKVSLEGKLDTLSQAVSLLENDQYQMRVTTMYVNKELDDPEAPVVKTKSASEPQKWHMDISVVALLDA
jgi:hypothetical protein